MIKVLNDVTLDKFIRIDHDCTQKEMLSYYNLLKHDIPAVMLKDSYKQGDVILLRKNKNIYVVMPGDSLDTIAQKLNTTVDSLVQVNGLKSPVLFVGQRLYIEK